MSHPPVNQQITFLYTHDLVATSQFYQDTMGFELVLDQGDCKVWRITPTTFLGFCQREQTSSQFVIYTLVTREVDVWYERLKARGVTFEKPPVYNEKYRIYHCFLRDPNGYLIEIQRFDHPFP